MALEAEFLASLNHPHIIKLRGVAYDGPSGFAKGPTGYFLIIDRLFETLDGRIKRWGKPSSAKTSISQLRKCFSLPVGKESTSDPCSSFPPQMTSSAQNMNERLSVGKFCRMCATFS